MIASLSIPWGEAKGDEDLGGYHLVWTRDMVSSASGLLASGNTETPLRALGSPMPLMWAHAEYIKVLPSTHDGQVFDRIPAVAERYQGRRRQQPIEVWAFNRHVRSVPPGTTPRAQAAAPFRLRWTADEWAVVEDTASTPTALGIEFVDVPIARLQAAPIRFTFFWPAAERWEGRDFAITVEKSPA